MSATNQNKLRDMFNVQASRKFEASGGGGQEIALNQFAIRRNVDVKRLKTQLWDSIKPILEHRKLTKAKVQA